MYVCAESLLVVSGEKSWCQGLRGFDRLFASFNLAEGLGFRKTNLRAAAASRGSAAAAAAAAAAGDPAAAPAAGKSQQMLAALDPFLVDMKDLNKPLSPYPLLKAERCSPCKGLGFRV